MIALQMSLWVQYTFSHQHTEVRPLSSLEWLAFSKKKLPARNTPDVTGYLQMTNSGVLLQPPRTLSNSRKKKEFRWFEGENYLNKFFHCNDYNYLTII